MNDDELARLQQQSRWLRGAVTVLAAGLLLIIVISFAFQWFPARAGPAETPFGTVAAFVVFWLPAAFYLWALLAIRRVLGEVAAGGRFWSALARGLRDAGLGLAAGAFTSALIQPNLMRLLRDAGWTGQIFASYAHFDVAYATVGAVGLALVLLSRLLRRAAAMQVELDEII